MGKIYSEIKVDCSKYLNFKLIQRKSDESIEILTDLKQYSHLVKEGANIILKIISLDNLETNETFYTDSNGLFVEKRKKGVHNYYKLNYNKLHNKIGSNFYPVT